MALALFVHEGHAIDYTPGTAKVPGEVVAVGTAIQGVVPVALAAGEKGSLRLDGVYLITKKTAGDNFDRGDYCTIDSSNVAEVDNVNGRHVCVEPAVPGTTEVKLKLNVR